MEAWIGRLPRYYFDVVDGLAEYDGIGTVLPDAKTMRNEALRFVSDLLAEEPMRLGLGALWTLIVRDDDGIVLRLDVQN